MPSDLSTLDLATLSAAESAIVAILRSKTCQWEQDSADALGKSKLSTAVEFKNWAFAPDLLAIIVGKESSALFSSPLDPQLPMSTCRSVEDLFPINASSELSTARTLNYEALCAL